MMVMQASSPRWSSSVGTSRERLLLPPIAQAIVRSPMGHPEAMAMAQPHMVMMVPATSVASPMYSPTYMRTPPAGSKMPMNMNMGFATPTETKKHARILPNATKSITLDLLRPHFDRPLAEVAAMFGICMTLMKKICRKNGVPRWPHRQIRGLRKSIWSIEKALRSCESDVQRRSYLEHLYKQQAKLAAILRGPDGNNKGVFHDLMMSIPCSPPSTPVAPMAEYAVASPVMEAPQQQQFSATMMAVATPPSGAEQRCNESMILRATYGPSPRSGEDAALRLPSIASLLAAHKEQQIQASTPTDRIPC